MSGLSGGSHPRVILALASVAVAFAAADTYVVVLALPEMMGSVDLAINNLQRAAPIVSGFLLGYVAMLPLIGRIADLRGRVPVLLMALVVFSFGSLITALAYDLPSMVGGRFLQGVGGGGLVPATLALVADLYPPDRRGVPLGVVSAVQELGSVLGPLFGALVLAVTDWRGIFAINVIVALLLAIALRQLAARDPHWQASLRWRFPDPIGLVLLVAGLGAAALTMTQPPMIARDLTWGQIFIPYTGEGPWLTPVGVVAMSLGLLFVARCWWARRPMIDLRGWWQQCREADLVGAGLLAVCLGGVILAFATADPEVQVFSRQGPWFLLGSAIAAGLFWWHVRHAPDPLIPSGSVSATPAWGSLVVSFFVGGALIAALIDIPIYARTTVYRDSQLDAALVLTRFLVALPIGAVFGGWLLKRLPAGVITAIGMVASALGFALMSRWDATALEHLHSDATLVLCGLGFGLALAPVNAALLATTDAAVHGVASALVVVARMIGMLVGISGLTTIGLRRFYAALGDGASNTEAALAQEHAVFLGAAGCALVAGVLALVLFRGASTRQLDVAGVLRGG